MDQEFAGRSRLVTVMPTDPRLAGVVRYTVSGEAIVLSGDQSGGDSPDIVLVVWVKLTMGRLSSLHAVVLLSSYTNASHRDWTAVPGGSGVTGQITASVLETSVTWDTEHYDPGIYYYGSVGSLGTVKVGEIVLYPASGGASCARCQEGEYCYNGDAVRCPANSRSPPGSYSISDCTCSPGFAMSPTNLEGYGQVEQPDGGQRGPAQLRDRAGREPVVLGRQ